MAPLYKLNFRRLCLVAIAFFGCMPLHCFAQPEMADTMRSNGKIYVVVAILATIFAGIFAYLIHIDRKIAKLERDSQ